MTAQQCNSNFLWFLSMNGGLWIARVKKKDQKNIINQEAYTAFGPIG
jgi:hypothetical protein